ncbi:MAG: AbrB/MazE/SpoVT family DNA-binding domain-containing protein [Clostridia bacterium]|nr:AbrB/MazE/SpoVT family DNA-binding domain-containing protein [Clostridia bacterium]
MKQKLDAFSRIYLPKEIRVQMDLSPGDFLTLIPQKNGVFLRKSPKEEPFFELSGKAVTPWLFD